MEILNNEIWKDVEEFDFLYQISNMGRLKSKERKVNSKIQKCGYRIISEKIKLAQDNGNGYKQYYIQINKIRRLQYVHRLVANYFIPNLENKKQVNHKNGIKSDNRVGNLEWCTQSENTAHAVKNKLMKSGEDSVHSKLTKQNVLCIRRLYRINPKFSKSDVSRKLGVRDSTIHKIINNERWKNLL